MTIDWRAVCCSVREPGVSRPGLHDHARLRLESSQSLRPHELLRSLQLPGSVPAVGPARLLPAPRQLHHRRHDGFVLTCLVPFYVHEVLIYWQKLLNFSGVTGVVKNYSKL